MTFNQIAVLIFFIFYCGVVVGFRGFLLYKRTGINTFSSRKKSGLEGFVEKALAFCFVLLVVIVVNFVFLEDNYGLLVPINYLEHTLVSLAGIILSMVGMVIGFISQLQMKDSWRIALNENENTELITQGLYAYSRNPIYLGYLISIFGLFLIMPNALSLCFVSLSYVAVGMKVRLEEIYLSKINGIAYKSYLKEVRRWI